jgi:hypothetical protein
MGVFFSSPHPVAPATQEALKSALMRDPKTIADPQTEAAAQAHTLAQTTAPQFNWRNFVGALVISAVLLGLAIALDNGQHKEISKALMTSFQSFSGIVLGLLGGEKPAK